MIHFSIDMLGFVANQHFVPGRVKGQNRFIDAEGFCGIDHSEPLAREHHIPEKQLIKIKITKPNKLLVNECSIGAIC